MTVWAGVDIGNATTEVVLCKNLEVLASARTPTRGGKGSQRAIEGAAQLVRRLADAHGLVVDRAAFAPTPPVHSAVERVNLQTRSTGRLAIALRSAATTAGDASGVGSPVPVEHLREAGDTAVVACAGTEWGYRDVATQVNAAVEAGVDVVAVLTANDEAVLVSNRLARALPVVDDVDVDRVLSATRGAVAGRHGWGPQQRRTDPFWLADVFALRDDERADARIVADQLFDSVCAVVTLGVVAADDEAQPEPDLPSGSAHVVHLGDIAAQANSRRGAVVVDSLVMATMGGAEDVPAGVDALEAALGIPVTFVDSEAQAARVGALTTPGVTPDVVVVDVGGGTVDVVGEDAHVVLPGAGQLLTTATAAALDVSRSAAEYAKRAEAVTAVTVQLVEDEHGRRRFLDKPIDGRCTGWLLATAPSGWLPFTSRLSGPEWRSWRLAAKRLVIGGNVTRGLERIAPAANGVLLVGGGASDDELVRAVSERLGHDVTVGRGNVDGQLGHRFAVAYGLVVLAEAAQTQP
jgi:hypothetical protein